MNIKKNKSVELIRVRIFSTVEKGTILVFENTTLESCVDQLKKDLGVKEKPLKAEAQSYIKCRVYSQKNGLYTNGRAKSFSSKKSVQQVIDLLEKKYL